MLAREVLRLRGTIYNRETPWDVMVDLYFCTCSPFLLTPERCWMRWSKLLDTG